MKNAITFANGKTLSVGDTFYFVHPEYHDGTIVECLVDSFWPEEYFYGDLIRFTTNKKSMWQFAYKKYFERESPTCFLDFADAQKAAAELLYTVR